MKDRITVGAFLALGILMCAVVIPQTVPVSFVPRGQIGPRFFPNLLAGAILAVAALIIAIEWLGRRAAPTQPVDTPAEDADARPHKAWLAGAIILVYVALMSWIGFVWASVAAVAAIMRLFGERRPLMLLGFAAVVPLVTWAFAVQVLQLPLP